MNFSVFCSYLPLLIIGWRLLGKWVGVGMCCCSVNLDKCFWKAHSQEVASGVSISAPGGWDGIVRLVGPNAMPWRISGKLKR